MKMSECVTISFEFRFPQKAKKNLKFVILEFSLSDGRKHIETVPTSR